MIHLKHADTHPAWCPGCGNFPILDVFEAAAEEAGLDRNRTVFVSGIGQAAKFPHYTEGNVFNGLHGRALPAATGIKLANHELEVIITSGDGDMYGEGGNHLVHAMRRNISIKAFVHNNQVYGLTKGQASPTSEIGFVTPIQIHGQKSAPFNPLAQAIIEDCSFVARTFCGDKEHMKRTMVAALRNESGFTLVDILQTCITFNKVNNMKWYRERIRPIDDSHDPADREAALRLAMQWGDEIPIGIFYRGTRAGLEQRLEALQQGTLVATYAGKA
jgi:2-oxoglutarate ferredoxin oxidoreductase subunit beta